MLYYEQFLRRFGGAPWIDTTLGLESEELLAPRLKRHELADKILNDMDEAIDRLPTHSQQENGRISKEVAMLYKARIALFEATWENIMQVLPLPVKEMYKLTWKRQPEWQNLLLTANSLT